MGLRSWMTPVFSKDDLDKVVEYAESHYGISYVIQITKKGTPFDPGDVWVAWSGDGSSSLEDLEPLHCREKTLLLDNLLNEFPKWHQGKKGPEKYGKLIRIENEEPDWALVVRDDLGHSDSDSKGNGDGQEKVSRGDIYNVVTSDKLRGFGDSIWEMIAGWIGGSMYSVEESDILYIDFKDINGICFQVRLNEEYGDIDLQVQDPDNPTESELQPLGRLPFETVVGYLEALPKTFIYRIREAQLDEGPAFLETKGVEDKAGIVMSKKLMEQYGIILERCRGWLKSSSLGVEHGLDVLRILFTDVDGQDYQVVLNEEVGDVYCVPPDEKTWPYEPEFIYTVPSDSVFDYLKSLPVTFLHLVKGFQGK